jgi:uncharacterized LabA/DUF88 family protein
MTSVAVFVDAGYLFAQGSTVLSGSSLPRSQLRLDNTAVASELKRVAVNKSDGCRLLRIYWYDGSSSGRLSTDQSAIANTDYIKLRLGQINSVGEQKGVDSLIVTDLIELARNKAVSDILLLTGDEDIRVGVQIAQSFGVRVHLLGISGKNSQSPLLMQEADTTSMFSKEDVEKFLSRKTSSVFPALTELAKTETIKPKGFDQVADEIANDLANTLDDENIMAFNEYRKNNRGIPPEFDGRLLAMARDLINRDLNQAEKKTLRARFVDAVKAHTPEGEKVQKITEASGNAKPFSPRAAASGR